MLAKLLFATLVECLHSFEDDKYDSNMLLQKAHKVDMTRVGRNKDQADYNQKYDLFEDSSMIICPMLGMLVKDGSLVPRVDGTVNMKQVLVAFAQFGVSMDFANRTTSTNFRGTVCPTCPVRVNLFHGVNVFPTRDLSIKKKHTVIHEHYRSTGIREGGGNESRLLFAQRQCAPNGNWTTSAAVVCMTNVFDRDPGCSYGNTLLASDDVDTAQRPTGCCTDIQQDQVCCEGKAQNPQCSSAMHTVTKAVFNMLKDVNTETISSGDWRRFWINMEPPVDSKRSDPPYFQCASDGGQGGNPILTVAECIYAAGQFGVSQSMPLWQANVGAQLGCRLRRKGGRNRVYFNYGTQESAKQRSEWSTPIIMGPKRAKYSKRFKGLCKL